MGRAWWLLVVVSDDVPVARPVEEQAALPADAFGVRHALGDGPAVVGAEDGGGLHGGSWCGGFVHRDKIPQPPRYVKSI
ncbi:MAG: hypothetical protein DRQ39_06140 [Gammaproteobacteria bacterium]|nr:MAG: hypothetical protein DRQ39_06140 [Gammaproteobacteria bacterium]